METEFNIAYHISICDIKDGNLLSYVELDIAYTISNI